MTLPPKTGRLRLVFADHGTFHSETVNLPLDKVGEYERITDLLREEPSVTRQLMVDVDRLVCAYPVEED